MLLRFSGLQNGVKVERWSGLTGGQGRGVNALTGDTRYPNNPDNTLILNTFKSENTTSGKKFGQRMRASFLAPETGTYKFRASCNAACEVKMGNNVHMEVIINANMTTGRRSKPDDFKE